MTHLEQVAELLEQLSPQEQTAVLEDLRRRVSLIQQLDSSSAHPVATYFEAHAFIGLHDLDNSDMRQVRDQMRQRLLSEYQDRLDE